MDGILLEAFKYNKWANLHLLDVCAGLAADLLQLTAPGTYGTIATTFQHQQSAEQRYVKRLGGSEPRLKEAHDFPGVAALKEHAARSGDELIEVAGRIKPDETVDGTGDEGPYRLSLWVVVVQAIHHGNDHRTQICTILGHNGISYSDMDVWAYGDAIGGIVSIGPPSATR